MKDGPYWSPGLPVKVAHCSLTKHAHTQLKSKTKKISKSRRKYEVHGAIKVSNVFVEN